MSAAITRADRVGRTTGGRVVLLHHGLFGLANFSIGKLRVRYFAGGIERAIAAGGHLVFATRVHPTAGIERRARELKTQILRQLRAAGRPRARIVIVGHSMGGLDARFMVTHLGMGEQVEAVVTIATPHRGSTCADWVFDNLGSRLHGAGLVRILGLEMRAFADLRTDAMRTFNEQTPDHPGTRYFSIATFQTARKIAPFFLPAHRVVERLEGDNDGVVSVRSAIWGEHVATWQTDHLHAINRRYTPAALTAAGDVSSKYADLIAHAARALGASA